MAEPVAKSEYAVAVGLMLSEADRVNRVPNDGSSGKKRAKKSGGGKAGSGLGGMMKKVFSKF